jgi:hypothetical protein
MLSLSVMHDCSYAIHYHAREMHLIGERDFHAKTVNYGIDLVTAKKSPRNIFMLFNCFLILSFARSLSPPESIFSLRYSIRTALFERNAALARVRVSKCPFINTNYTFFPREDTHLCNNNIEL